MTRSFPAPPLVPLAPPPPPPPPRIQEPLLRLPPLPGADVFTTNDIIKKQFTDCGETNNFHRLTRAGDVQGLIKLAATNPELVNSRDHLGRTPLWICASVNCPWTRETLECLCKLGSIEIDKPDVRDQTPLFAAVKYNHIENAKLLLEYGANPNGIGSSTESPVHVAVRDGFTSMTEVLLSNGASPDGRESGLRIPNFGTIPLYTAIIYDRFDEFILLLRYGAEPNLIMQQPGFSNSLIDGSIRHNADVKWIKALFIAGMSPYQEIHRTRDTPDVRQMMSIINQARSSPRSLKASARQTILRAMKSRFTLGKMPLAMPKRLLHYLHYPELSTL